MNVMVIMSQEDDDRNKAVEAAGTAVVGAGLLGGLLFGGGLLAKAIGDAVHDNAEVKWGKYNTSSYCPCSNWTFLQQQS